MPAANHISRLAVLRDVNSYSDAGDKRKDTMHRCGRAFLRMLAKDLGLGKGMYDLRSNQAGIAVSGEVTLHTDRLYVQVSEYAAGKPGVSILYRSCEGRRDCVGGQNHRCDFQRLAEGGYPAFLAHCVALAAPGATPARRALAHAA